MPVSGWRRLWPRIVTSRRMPPIACASPMNHGLRSSTRNRPSTRARRWCMRTGGPTSCGSAHSRGVQSTTTSARPTWWSPRATAGIATLACRSRPQPWSLSGTKAATSRISGRRSRCRSSPTSCPDVSGYRSTRFASIRMWISGAVTASSVASSTRCSPHTSRAASAGPCSLSRIASTTCARAMRTVPIACSMSRWRQAGTAPCAR